MPVWLESPEPRHGVLEEMEQMEADQKWIVGRGTERNALKKPISGSLSAERTSRRQILLHPQPAAQNSCKLCFQLLNTLAAS